MKKSDQNFLQEMRGKLDIDLLGVASVESSNSQELRKQAISLLPGVKSVVVLGKQVYKEVVTLLGPAKSAG
ncbi:MAG: hypothetical protein Q8O18_07160, partial [Deltaproteobacteria bacterium]|nr:hypothetical protein [Deltaproteobacteria bacterium]